MMNLNKLIRTGNISEAQLRDRYENLYRSESDNRYQLCTLEAPLVWTHKKMAKLQSCVMPCYVFFIEGTEFPIHPV
jgi:hypothetical protein